MTRDLPDVPQAVRAETLRAALHMAYPPEESKKQAKARRPAERAVRPSALVIGAACRSGGVDKFVARVDTHFPDTMWVVLKPESEGGTDRAAYVAAVLRPLWADGATRVYPGPVGAGYVAVDVPGWEAQLPAVTADGAWKP